ncbi:MAG: GNAT family N-acetyltransferase [Hyphomicrobiales bacterium]
MALLRQNSFIDTGPVIFGDEVMLRAPLMSDYGQWAELRSRSREFLTPWEPTWAASELTRGSFRRRLRYYARDMREDLGYAFFVFSRSGGLLLGGLTLSNVRRGVAQAGTLGYWVGAPHARKGHMSDALRAFAPFAFESLRLHRIEAACLPHNKASIRLLEKTGFRREGLAQQYLKINGLWQDHVLFALLEDHLRP